VNWIVTKKTMSELKQKKTKDTLGKKNFLAKITVIKMISSVWVLDLRFDCVRKQW